MQKADLSSKLGPAHKSKDVSAPGSKTNNNTASENIVKNKKNKKTPVRPEKITKLTDNDNPMHKLAKKDRSKQSEITQKDYDDFEASVETAEAQTETASKEEDKKNSKHSKIVQILLIIGCVYLIFLIYGAINTQYVYNAKGNVVAQPMSVKEIEAKNDYDKFAAQYRQARTLYEKVLLLDYRIGAGEEDPLTIAPEYEKLLDSVDKLSIQVQALELSSEYTQVLTMLTSWIQNDLAIYCQDMSKAISQNDSSAEETALEYKTIMYNDFSSITQNLVTIGKKTTGADYSDISKWSPEEYVQTQIGGVKS